MFFEPQYEMDLSRPPSRIDLKPSRLPPGSPSNQNSAGCFGIYTFPGGSLLPPGGYLVVASNPNLLRQEGVTAVMGPWSGTLSESTGTLELFNDSGRLMDFLTYGSNALWQVTAAGSGASLSRRDPVTLSEREENWPPHSGPLIPTSPSSETSTRGSITVESGSPRKTPAETSWPR